MYTIRYKKNKILMGNEKNNKKLMYIIWLQLHLIRK